MKCNTGCCNNSIPEGAYYCEECEWQVMEDHLDSLHEDRGYIYEEEIECTCPECKVYTHDGSWCEQCLDAVDLDEYEERKRRRLAEAQEY